MEPRPVSSWPEAGTDPLKHTMTLMSGRDNRNDATCCAKKKKKKRPSAEMLAGAHRSHVSDSRYSQAFPTCNDSYLEVFVLCFFPLSVCGWEPKVTSWCYGVRGHGPLPGSALLTLWTSPQYRDRPLTSCPASPSWTQLLCVLISLSREVMPFSFLNPSNRLAAVFERPGPHTHLTNCTETNAQTIRGRDAAPWTLVVFACTPGSRTSAW